MSKIYLETGTLTANTERGPFSKAHLQAACQPGGAALEWYNDDEPPSWHPYIVKVVKLDAAQNLEFKVIKSEQSATGPDELPDTFTVNLTNRDMVWIEHPSTISKTVGVPATGQEYGFLFLSEAYRLSNTAITNAGTKSKWPKGSEFVSFIEAVERLVKEARGVVDKLTPAEQYLLKQYPQRVYRS